MISRLNVSLKHFQNNLLQFDMDFTVWLFLIAASGSLPMLVSSQAESCIAGQYYSTVTDQCESCDYSTYQHEPGKMFCITCNSGTTTIDKAATSQNDCLSICEPGLYYSVIEPVGCRECPVGSYSPGGQLADRRLRTSCVACTDGLTTQTAGATSQQDCVARTNCDEGYFLEGSSCSPCPRGYYRPLTAETCIFCGEGYTTVSEASTSGDQCVLETGTTCSAGEYLDDSSCLPCPLNTYQPEWGQFTSCISCSDGLITLQIGSTSSSQCVVSSTNSPTTNAADCPPGNFLWGNTECRPCGLGSYQNMSNQVECHNCGLGFTTRQTGSTSKTQCVAPCFPGSYIQPNGQCALCPLGTYQHQNDRASCIDCPSGTTTTELGAKHVDSCATPCPLGEYFESNLCVPCPRGSYRDTLQDPTCTACPDGYSTPSVGADQLSDCQPVCGAGSYITNTGGCLECTVGTYQPLASQTSCLACSSGLTTRQPGATSIQQCVAICQVGYYPSGSSCRACEIGTYQDTPDQPSCKTCPVGLTTRSTGSISSSACVESCRPGTYISEQNCLPCPKGSYQFEMDKTLCIQCSNGFTTASEGSTEASQCLVICDAGSYIAGSVCTTCPIGKIQPEEGQSFCIDCDDGKTTLQSGSKFASDCVDICSPGYVLQNRVCTACGLGFYQPSPGQTTCIPCPEGQSTGSTASQSPDDCNDICRPGTFLDGNQCRLCPLGTYQPEPASTSCLSCPDSRTTRETGATSSSLCIRLCAAGEYWNSTQSVCVQCPIGSFTEQEGSVRCTNCPTGYSTQSPGADDDQLCVEICGPGSFPSAQRICEACPLGSYKETTGFASCTPCSGSRTTFSPGATSSTDCKLTCRAGEYVQGDHCVQCAQGYYRPEPSPQASCLQCPGGQTTIAGGSTSPTDCFLECPAGFAPVRDNCSPCERGYYKETTASISCTSCPSGTVTEGVAATSVSQCSQPACEPGSHIFGNICKPCEKGSYQELKWQTSCTRCRQFHTTASDSSTSADHCMLLCGAGYYPNSENTSCALCGVGTYKTAAGNMPCTICPDGRLTVGEGASSLSQCSVPRCEVGTSLNINTLRCDTCVTGTYQDRIGQTSCKSCPRGFTTYPDSPNYIADSIDDCLSVNVCEAGQHDCHAFAVCSFIRGSSFRCHCNESYFGDGKTCTLHSCYTSEPFCENGGTCERRGDAATCQCANNYEGTRCEMQSSGGLSNTVIIAISVVAGVILIIIIIVLAWYCLCGRRVKDHLAAPVPVVVHQASQPPLKSVTAHVKEKKAPRVSYTPPQHVYTHTPPLTPVQPTMPRKTHSTTPPTAQKQSVFTRSSESHTPPLQPLSVYVEKPKAPTAVEVPEENVYHEADGPMFDELHLEQSTDVYANADPTAYPRKNSSSSGAVFLRS